MAIIDKNAIARAVLRVAAERGMKNMADNPERGMRYLVDLVGAFSKNELQKSFFDSAITELQNKQSMYYRLFRRMIDEISHPNIITFGINLAYNCWTMGTGIIRKRIESGDYCVPWYLTISLGGNCKLNVEDINSLMETGKELGIYGYVLLIDSGYRHIDTLLSAIKAQKECVCMVLMDSEMVDIRRAELILNCRNVLPLLNMDSAGEFAAAAGIFRERGAFYGGFSRYGAAKKADASKLLKRGELEGCAAVFFVGDAQAQNNNLFQDNLSIDEGRAQISAAVFPVDMYHDFGLIGENRTGRVCMAMVMDDRSVLTRERDSSGINAKIYKLENNLEGIFREAFPKSLSGSAGILKG